MAPSTDDENIYHCETQHGDAPVSIPMPITRASKPGFHPIMVGRKDIIPRWDTRTTKPLVLKYYLQKSTFSNKDDAVLAENLLVHAAKIWNDVGCGVFFQASSDPSKAHFDVVYDERGSGSTIARAFFPNEPKNVYIFPIAFSEERIKKQLLNTITHELGHVLGLRHEHWETRNETRAVQIGEKNADSIMGYNHATRKVQQSDIKGLLEFYSYDNGHKLEQLPITDFQPQLVKRDTKKLLVARL